MDKLNAKQLRKTQPDDQNYRQIKRNPIYLVLDNIIDTYNIGSLFRLAERHILPQDHGIRVHFITVVGVHLHDLSPQPQ